MPFPAHNITYKNQTHPIEVWAKKTGIAPATLRSRLFKFKWPVEKALTTPVEKRFSRGGRKPADAPRACPQLKRHADGRAYVSYSLYGKQQFKSFGTWASDEALGAYRRFQLGWAAGEPGTSGPSAGATVARLGLRWLAHCKATYRKRGRQTSEVHCNRAVWAVLGEHFGHEPASEFTPAKLRLVREAMVERGWVRNTVNAQVQRIVRAFAWAATERMVPSEVHALLALVEPLVAGRREDLPEGEGVPPAPEEDVAAVLKGTHLHPEAGRRAVLAAMIRVQLLSAMRPGEVCSLRANQIDRRKTPWRYEVREFNKMLHKDVGRPVFFGPKARKLLAPFLNDAGPADLVFRLPPARKGASPAALTPRSYRDFVQAACDRAGVPRWAPNQLRHNRATEVMDRYEDDQAVGALLGNTAEVARQVYAARAGETVARRIAEATG